MPCTIALVELGRRHRLPPELASRARDIGTSYTSASGTEIPAHVQVVWREQDGAERTERVWAMVISWSSLAMHCTFWRHGQWEVWVRREDIEPCPDPSVHRTGAWPVDNDPHAADSCRPRVMTSRITISSGPDSAADAEQTPMRRYVLSLADGTFVAEIQAPRDDLVGQEGLVNIALEDSGWALAGPVERTEDRAWGIDVVPV